MRCILKIPVVPPFPVLSLYSRLKTPQFFRLRPLFWLLRNKRSFSDDYVPRAHDGWDSCERIVVVMSVTFFNVRADGAPGGMTWASCPFDPRKHTGKMPVPLKAVLNARFQGNDTKEHKGTERNRKEQHFCTFFFVFSSYLGPGPRIVGFRGRERGLRCSEPWLTK